MKKKVASVQITNDFLPQQIMQGITIPRVAIAVQGSPSCGKSNFIIKFCSNAKDTYASLRMEVMSGKSYRSYCYKSRIISKMDQPIELILVEIPSPLESHGEEEVAPLWKLFSGCIVLSDTTKKDEVNNVMQLAAQWRHRAREDKLQNIIICGTKTDYKHRCYISNVFDVEKFCDQENIQFVDTTAVDDYSVFVAVHFLCNKMFTDKNSMASSCRLLDQNTQNSYFPPQQY